MKTRPFLLILTISLTLLTTTHAQKKLDEALYQFQNTAFMKQFREMKSKAEGEIVVFKQEQGKYAPRDIQKVKMAYDETARRFNKVLKDIKRDFLDKQKMKYISQYPDSYSKGLELELYKLSNFYNSNFRQTVRDVTGEETFGNPLLLLLPQLVMMSSDLVKQMQRIRAESRQFTESYLQQKLIEPNRFQYWNEVGQAVYTPSYPTNENTTAPWDNGGTNTNDGWNDGTNGTDNDWDTNGTDWNNNNNNGNNNGNNTNNDWNNNNNNNTSGEWQQNNNIQGSSPFPPNLSKPVVAGSKKKKKKE